MDIQIKFREAKIIKNKKYQIRTKFQNNCDIPNLKTEFGQNFKMIVLSLTIDSRVNLWFIHGLLSTVHSPNQSKPGPYYDNQTYP